MIVALFALANCESTYVNIDNTSQC